MTGFEAMQDTPVYFWLICFLSVMAVSISKSGFGGALGSLSTPILLFVLPPKLALGVLLPLFLITDVWVVYLWRQWMNRRFALIMCGFGIAGQLAGWLLFDYLNDRVLILLIGLVGIIIALDYGRQLIWPSGVTNEEVAKRMLGRIWQRAFGWCGLSGLASFVSLSGGIPAQIFLLPHGLARQAFVGTMTIYFFTINVAKLPFYGDLGLFTRDTMIVSACLLPLIPIGVYAGRQLNRMMSDQIFYHFSYSVLFAMSVKLIYDAVAG